MNVGEVKKVLQGHFSDGLVTIVGSGLSMAAGLPGMRELAMHLPRAVRKRCNGQVSAVWQEVESRLKNSIAIEPALADLEIESPLVEVIIDETARFVESRERTILAKVCRGELSLPFAKMLKYITFSGDRACVITTNYDRLIELAAEKTGLAIDTLFPGQYYGEFNSRLSREAVCTGRLGRSGATIKRVYRKHLAIIKPHGSLDWFLDGDHPVRCTLPLDAPRLMITPGHNKYRMGYEKPFDQHRDEANKAIDGSARLLIIGYGFNDDQLETHLKPEIEKGKPCVILARHLSENASKLVKANNGVLAISCDRNDADTVIAWRGEAITVRGSRMWNLEDFVREVLE